MFENIYLEPEQIDLFCEMVRAMRSVPREERHEFFISRTFGGDTLLLPGSPGTEKKIYFGDLEELTRQGLLVKSYGSGGSPKFDITASGYRYYDYIKQQTGNKDSDEISQYLSPPDLNVRVSDSIGVSDSASSKPIFLSYAREDKSAVEEITNKLSRDGFKVWFDKEDLLPGDNWKAKIGEAIENAQYILVFLSPRSIAKTGYFQKEIKYILEQRDLRPSGQRFIIPILLESCETPREFRDIQLKCAPKFGQYRN